MGRAPAIVVAVGAALVAGLAVALATGRMPLGIPGEWEWSPVRHGPHPMRVAVALLGIAAYATFAALGSLALARRDGRLHRAIWVAALVPAGFASQGLIQEGAPEAYGLEKWIMALHHPGANGYYTVAREHMGDPSKFLVDYPSWIARQDALHIGTHPPGLFVATRATLDQVKRSPALARVVLALAPPSTTSTIKLYRENHGLQRPEAAALTLIGMITLLACASTVVPLYLLARCSGLSATSAWASAAMWPMVPSALMFQPTADTAFPLLSTSALALAAWSRGEVGIKGLAALGAGLILGVGMMFTLAFLPVGLIVALVIALPPDSGWPRRLGMIVATGVGFLAVTLASWAMTLANPFAIWWHNQANHSRFYVENPRTYWAWVLANPIELAVGLGLLASIWAIIGLAAPRANAAPRVSWATVAVLVLLTVGGRSLSEIARLWLPFMPALLVAAGAGFGRLGGGPRSTGATTALMGLQALVMENLIQVVYPV